MKSTKSKMSKKFDEHRERGLRCMADGGLVGNRMQRMEAMAGATAPVTLSANPGMASMTPQPAVAQAPVPAPAQPMTAEEAEWQRIKAEKLAPKPTIMSNVKKVFGFADGGGVFDNVESGSSTSRSLRSINSSFVKRDPNALKIRTPQAMIGVRGNDGGATKDIIKRSGLRGALRHAEVHEGPGIVKGPGTRTSDSVDAKLSKDEYVLPGDTVEAIGKENLDEIVMNTHEFVNKPSLRDGVVYAADGDPGLRYRRMTPNAGPQQPAYTSPGQPINARPTLAGGLSPEAAAYGRNAAQQTAAFNAAKAAAPAARPVPGIVSAPGFAAGSGMASAVQTYNTPTSEYARRLGVDEPSSFMGDLAVRGAGALQDLGNTLTFGVADRLGNALTGGGIDHSTAYNAPVQTAATTQPAAPAAQAAAAPARQPVTIDNATGQPVDATTLRSSRVGDNVSITGDGGPVARPMQTVEGRQATLRAAYAPTQYEGRPGQSTNSLVAEANPMPQTQLPARTIGEQFDRDVAAKRANKDRRLQAELDVRERDSLRQYGASAERNAVTLRGQDMTARTAKEAGARDQQNKDRQFSLDVAKYGTDVAEKNRAAASAADESLQKTLESRFRTTDANGKDVADTAKVGAFRTAVSATMPRMIEQLEATRNPAAIAKAQQLRQRGAAALEPGDWDNLQQYYDTRDRMRASKGMGPNQASMAESDNLLDYRQSGVEHRTLGGNRVVTPAGSISYNDLRYTEPANKVLPDFFKTENRNLTRGLRRE